MAAVGVGPLLQRPLVGLQHHVDGDVAVGVHADLQVVAVRVVDRFVELILRHRQDAVVLVPTYGVLIRIVRSDAEPSATNFTPPTRIHSSPKPVWMLAAFSAAVRLRRADHHVGAVRQLAVLPAVLVGEDVLGIGHRRCAPSSGRRR